MIYFKERKTMLDTMIIVGVMFVGVVVIICGVMTIYHIVDWVVTKILGV